MKEAPDPDPRIHQATRLRIMALLFRNRRVYVTWLRDQLGLTDGNLASHAARLEAEGLVRQVRTLTPRGFQNELFLTAEGDAAFRSYVETLRRLVGVGQP